MNVSINLLAAPPSKWYAPKAARNPDPLKRWHSQDLRAAEPQSEPRYVVPQVHSSLTLKDAHYAAMEAQKAKTESLGCYARVPRQLAAISGYGGFIPMKESHNVLGVSFKKANKLAASIQAASVVHH
jgi:hypothetical protein